MVRTSFVSFCLLLFAGCSSSNDDANPSTCVPGEVAS